MVMERGKSIAVRLRDLGLGGDGMALLGVALLIAGASGALLGHLLGSTALGLGIGMLLAVCAWAAAAAWSHRQPQPPPRHRDPERD